MTFTKNQQVLRIAKFPKSLQSSWRPVQREVMCLFFLFPTFQPKSVAGLARYDFLAIVAGCYYNILCPVKNEYLEISSSLPLLRTISISSLFVSFVSFAHMDSTKSPKA